MRWLLALMLVLCAVGVCGVEYSFQEFANSTTVNGTWNGDGSNTIDGNYSSSDYSALGGFIYQNYTLPDGFINATWRIKSVAFDGNVSIPSICNVSGQIRTQIRSKGDHAGARLMFYCYNSTAWQEVRRDGGIGEQVIFEDGIYWAYEPVVPLPTPTPPTTQTKLGLFFGALMTIGIGVIIGRSIYENKRV